MKSILVSATLASLLMLPGVASSIEHGALTPIASSRGPVTAFKVAASGDGRFLYVATGASVLTVRRQTATGAIELVPGPSGCVADGPDSGVRCRNAVGMPAIRQLAPSADGRNLYVASREGLAVFRRDRRSGELEQLAGAAGCLNGSGANGCAPARAIADTFDVVVSRDGRNVYAILRYKGVLSFVRDAATGALTQLADDRGCRTADAIAGCSWTPELDGANAIAVSPDGASVYVTAGIGLVVLARDRASGALTPLPGRDGCVGDAPDTDCTPSPDVRFAYDVLVSPDGRNVYVVGDGLAVLRRDRRSGALAQLPDPAGCLAGTGSAHCLPGRAAGGPAELAISPRGDTLYVVSEHDSIAAFARSRESGALAQLAGTAGCLRDAELDPGPCGSAPGLRNATDGVVSPDGRNVYVANGNSGDAIGVFARSQGQAGGRLRVVR